MHHSDRGSQYVREQFQRLMADSGIICSMSRSGNVWDNAAMESFFSSLRTERIEREIYRTRNQSRCVRLHRAPLQQHPPTFDDWVRQSS
jgi:putative transposase